MAGPVANAANISAQLKMLLAAAIPPGGSATYFQAVYEGMPEAGFQAQSPVGVIDFITFEGHNFTAGAGRMQDIWAWEITVYVDKTQQAFTTAYQLRLSAVDVLRTAIHSHVQLGDANASTSIFLATLDGGRSRPDFTSVEGALYSVVHFTLRVKEQYNVPLPIYP